MAGEEASGVALGAAQPAPDPGEGGRLRVDRLHLVILTPGMEGTGLGSLCSPRISRRDVGRVEGVQAGARVGSRPALLRQLGNVGEGVIFIVHRTSSDVAGVIVEVFHSHNGGVERTFTRGSSRQYTLRNGSCDLLFLPNSEYLSDVMNNFYRTPRLILALHA